MQKQLHLATMETTASQSGVPTSALYCAADLARLLGLSERTDWRLASAGNLPQPIRLGRSVRWRVAEIQAWLEQGCPGRREWKVFLHKGKGVQ